MCDQDNRQLATLQRPTTDNREDWQAYWRQQGQPWRTEPEIDTKRQEELARRRAIVPDIVKGIYPFQEMKLSRADVEWLLATHENGRGPVNWNDESQRGREGSDLRGADLREVDLRNLPLARLHAGPTLDERKQVDDEPRNTVSALMERADLRDAHLEGAYLCYADLNYASLSRAHLEQANLQGAHLEHARCRGTDFRYAIFRWATLKEAHLRGSNLEGADFSEAYLEGVRFVKAHLSDAKQMGPRVVDAHWDGVNLAVVEWSRVVMLGDEYIALQTERNGRVIDKDLQLAQYEMAVRANRQLAVALQTQGLNEVAARFAYRAQKLQRIVFRLQGGTRSWMQYILSLLLDVLAGYGYKPWRSFLAYIIVITAFAVTYFLIGRTVGPALSPLGAWVFSMTSFHGRGFFPGGITLDDPLTVVAAFEAFVGLLIEVTFIATLTQRLFGK